MNYFNLEKRLPILFALWVISFLIALLINMIIPNTSSFPDGIVYSSFFTAEIVYQLKYESPNKRYIVFLSFISLWIITVSISMLL